jgi:hypothetical protein
LYFFWNQYGTDNWQPETVAGAGTTFSSPSISVSGDTVIIAAQGPNDSPDFYWQQIGASGWHPEQVAGRGTTFSAPSLTGNGGHVNIVAQGPSHSLDFYWQKNGASGWNPEVVVGGGTTMSAPCPRSGPPRKSGGRRCCTLAPPARSRFLASERRAIEDEDSLDPVGGN